MENASYVERLLWVFQLWYPTFGHFLLLFLTPLILSIVVGVKKQRAMFGFLLGFFFSWLGFIVVCCFKRRQVQGDNRKNG